MLIALFLFFLVVITGFRPLDMFLGVFFCALYYLWIKRFSNKVDSLSSFWYMFLFCFIFFSFAVLLLFFSSSIRCHFPADTKIVYDSVAFYLDHGDLTGVYGAFGGYSTLGFITFSDYFCRYYNNIFMFVTLAVIYSFGKHFGFYAGTPEGQVLGIVATALFLLIGILFLCKTVYLITHSKNRTLLALLLCAAFVSLYYSCTNVYTDIWVIPPMLIAPYFWVRYKQEHRFGFVVLFGTFVGLGALYKITALIEAVAILILLFFDREITVNKKLLITATVICLLLLIFFTFKLWYKNCGIFDFSKEKELYYPWQTWLCFGSHGNGMYNRSDCELIYSTPYEERSAVVWKEIISNYSSYSPAEYVSFLFRKWKLTWADGTFDGQSYTQWPLFDEWSWTLRFTQPSFRTFHIVTAFSNGYIAFLYFFSFISALTNKHNKRLQNATNTIDVCLLIFFGFLLYLSFFESAPRRALPAVFPLIIILSLLRWSDIKQSLFISKKTKKQKTVMQLNPNTANPKQFLCQDN